MKIITFNSFEEWFTSLSGAPSLFDPVRKKQVSATPEEKVRQYIIRHLIEARHYPRALLGVEAALTVNRLSRRCDLIAYKDARPVLLVECKSPSVRLDQSVFEQAARYNLTLQVPYLLVTNGLLALCAQVDLGNSTFAFLAEVPSYPQL